MRKDHAVGGVRLAPGSYRERPVGGIQAIGHGRYAEQALTVKFQCFTPPSLDDWDVLPLGVVALAGAVFDGRLVGPGEVVEQDRFELDLRGFWHSRRLLEIVHPIQLAEAR